jgi:hypothetical protein
MTRDTVHGGDVIVPDLPFNTGKYRLGIIADVVWHVRKESLHVLSAMW